MKTDVTPVGIPVIAGTGVTGLAISRMLSQSGIEHCLVGPEPSQTPRLGESLDVTGTIELLESYSEFEEFYSRKTQVDIWCGDEWIQHFNAFLANAFPSRVYRALTGFEFPACMLHVDRVGFDKALFNTAVQNEKCNYYDSKIKSVSYANQSDRVDKIFLTDQTSVECSYLFDATIYQGPMATAAGLIADRISSNQFVAFQHFRVRPLPEATQRPRWRDTTSIVRLLPETDKIDGMMWVIPFGDSVSIGINIDDQANRCDADELIDLSITALCQRGILQRLELEPANRVLSQPFYYFNYQKYYGANWILAGSAARQVWFMSGAGVGAGLAIARIAPDIVRDPRQASRFDYYLSSILKSHQSMNCVRYDYWWRQEPNAMPSKLIRSGGVGRTTAYCYLRRFLLTQILSRSVELFTPLRFFGHFFTTNSGREQIQERLIRKSPTLDGPLNETHFSG